MKVFVRFFAVVYVAAVSIFCFSLFAPFKKAYASALTYGVLTDGAILYSGSAEGYTAVTTLPKDYFVVLLGEENADGYLSVSYLDVTGYIKSDTVVKVDYEPKYKYAENNSLTLKNDGQEINVRSHPDHASDNVISELTEGTKLYYYGTVKGSSQVAALGDEWYYVRFTDGNETKRGYVYSLYVTADPIKPNVIEKVEETENENSSTEGEENSSPVIEKDPGDFTLDRTGEIIIIVSLCLPVIVIMYLLFRQPPKKTPDDRTKNDF